MESQRVREGKKFKSDKNSWDKKRLVIESIVAILCVLIGNVWGKNSSTYYCYYRYCCYYPSS